MAAITQQEIDVEQVFLLLEGLHEEQHQIIRMLQTLTTKLEELEAEFAPIARKAGRLAAASAALPGAGWRRKT